MVKISIYDIDWDVDEADELEDLPDEIIFNFPTDAKDVVLADVFRKDGKTGVSDYISDFLTEEYGFCHRGFAINIDGF